MTVFIVAFTIILAFIGAGIAIWSLLSTRKKYYKEYTVRKRND
jgi:hypothetical protein